MSDVTPGRPDLAVASVLAGGLPARNRVTVDLNEFRTNRIVVEFDDFDRPPMLGDRVDAIDPAGGQQAAADVVGVNEATCAAALVIDWASLREVSA